MKKYIFVNDYIKKEGNSVALEIHAEEYKKIVNEVLAYTDKVCRQNNITYYLAYGSLLGAVRHKGFIPWDDDIDIIMDRKNFEQFISSVRNDGHNYYKLMWITEDKEYDLPLPKIVDTRTRLKQTGRKSNICIGAWVDILIIDDVPDDLSKQKRVLKKFDFYEECWNWSQYSMFSIKNSKNIKQVIRFFIMRLLSMPGSRYWAKKMNREAGKYNDKGYKTFSALTFSGGKRKVYLKEWLGAGCDVEFEGEKYRAPENWHEYLKNAYGDYMKLPPVEKQVSNHNFTVYYKG